MVKISKEKAQGYKVKWNVSEEDLAIILKRKGIEVEEPKAKEKKSKK